MKPWKIALTVFTVLLLDQTVKFWVKLNMTLNETMPILGDLFEFHFVENPGMAFGLVLPGVMGKLALSIFRIFAIGFIIYYINLLNNKGAHWGLIFCVSLILAGAIGNMVDSAFYGLIFSESGYHNAIPAQLFPDGGGYGKFLQGRVVDMCKVNLIDTELPTWLSFGKTGARFRFFEPIFNFADSSITLGVMFIILFQKTFFRGLDEKMSAPAKDETLEDSITNEEDTSIEAATSISEETPPQPEESRSAAEADTQEEVPEE